MKINELILYNFRIFEYTQLQFDDKINIITGENGQGKTSILEALALFALGKSVRAKQDQDLIRFGQTAAQLRLNLISKGNHEQLAVKITEKGKQIAVNQVRKNNITDLIGKFQMVLFTPDDLEIIKNGPDQRRKFINQHMVQLSGEYVKELRTYQRLLNQRNLLLKQRQYSAIPMWDERLSKSGAKITYDRKLFINKVSQLASVRYQQLAGEHEHLQMTYRSSSDGETFETISGELEERLRKNLIKDKEKGFTSVGPHRDDVSFEIDGRPAARFASQGQIRSAILAVKLSLMDHFKDKLGQFPVLLLDDVLSELDEKRQNSLLNMINQTQTMMTVSQPGIIQGNDWAVKRIFEVGHGIIKDVR